MLIKKAKGMKGAVSASFPSISEEVINLVDAYSKTLHPSVSCTRTGAGMVMNSDETWEWGSHNLITDSCLSTATIGMTSGSTTVASGYISFPAEAIGLRSSIVSVGDGVTIRVTGTVTSTSYSELIRIDNSTTYAYRSSFGSTITKISGTIPTGVNAKSVLWDNAYGKSITSSNYQLSNSTLVSLINNDTSVSRTRNRLTVLATGLTVGTIVDFTIKITNIQWNHGITLLPYVPTSGSAVYKPRWGYNYSGEPMLYLEGQVTNLVTNNAKAPASTTSLPTGWTEGLKYGGLNISGIASTLLNGLSGFQFTYSGTPNTNDLYSISTSATITPSTAYTFSAYIQTLSAITDPGIKLAMSWYDSNSSLISTTSGTAIVSSVKFQRVSLTATAPSNAVAVTVSIRAGVAPIIGTANTFTTAVMCAQLELGGSATTPIPTYGSAVTRAADTFSVNNEKLGLNNVEGGVVFKGLTNSRSGYYPAILRSGTNAPLYVENYCGMTDNPSVSITTAGVLGYGRSVAACSAWGSAGIRLSQNGATAIRGTYDGTMVGTTLTTDSEYYGGITCLGVTKNSLSDARMAEYSSWKWRHKNPTVYAGLVEQEAVAVAESVSGLLYTPTLSNTWTGSTQTGTPVVGSGVGALKPIVGSLLAVQATSANKPILKREPILGPELVADPSFNDPTKWALTQPTSGSITISDGDLSILSLDGTWTGAIAVAAQITQGKAYRTVMTVKSYTGGQGVRIDVGGVSGNMWKSAGVFESVIVAAVTGASSVNVARGGGVAGSGGVVSEVSVREILGYRDVYYLAYDGINDCLATTSASFTLSDGLVMVWAGSLNQNISGRRLMMAYGSATRNFAIRCDGSGVNAAVYSGTGVFGGTLPASLGELYVFTLKLTTSNLSLRKNGGAWLSIAHGLSLSEGALDIRIGIDNNLAVYSNQNNYASFCANMGANATDANIAKIERYFAQLLGITL